MMKKGKGKGIIIMADEDVIFYNPIWFLILSTK
jgi:hypothetical protein